MAVKYKTTFSEESGKQQSTVTPLLNEDVLNAILSGLPPQMTQEEIAAFAQNLLRPQLSAGIEAAQHEYETTRLAKEQEIENLAAELARSIEEQGKAYRQSTANVETAALARGMGRSSYTLETLANQGDALARAVMQLTDENARRSDQIRRQITQSAQQSARTQGRLQTDYASQLAAKIQELTLSQNQTRNQNYLTAISAAMGQQSTSDSQNLGKTWTEGGSAGTGMVSAPAANAAGDMYTTYLPGAQRPDENKGSGANPKYTGGNRTNISIN